MPSDQHPPDYDVVFRTGAGIGNVIQTLYAIEYCLRQRVRVGLSLFDIPASFQAYLRKCYPDLLLEPGARATCRHLVHSFLAPADDAITYQHYFYVLPDEVSTAVLSETELQLSIVQALFPGGRGRLLLERLVAIESDRTRSLAGKVVLYPGCRARTPVKRWPYFAELSRRLGPDEVVVVGGTEDLSNVDSHYYPRWMTAMFGRLFTSRREFWLIAKRLGLLRLHGDNRPLLELPHVYFETLSWEELAAVLKQSRFYVGNDGGLTHFAAALGATGTVVFGPSSVAKNRPINTGLRPLKTPALPCQPCQFGKGGIWWGQHFINCPYQIKCLYSISPDDVMSANVAARS